MQAVAEPTAKAQGRIRAPTAGGPPSRAGLGPRTGEGHEAARGGYCPVVMVNFATRVAVMLGRAKTTSAELPEAARQ